MPCAKKSLILAVLFKCCGQSPGLILLNCFVILYHSHVLTGNCCSVNQSAFIVQPCKLYSWIVKVECCSLCCT